jgi:hypothetical protein
MKKLSQENIGAAADKIFIVKTQWETLEFAEKFKDFIAYNFPTLPITIEESPKAK